MKLRFGRQGRRAGYTRLVEERLGRQLLSDEVVHHINLDPNDNRAENLRVITNTEHSALHNKYARYLRVLEEERRMYVWEDDIFWSRLSSIDLSEIAA